MEYKYQLHTHTSPTSRCAKTTPEQLAEALFKAGYSGCVLTNHFFHGNSGIDRELPWKEFVRCYENDYLACKAECEKYGLDVLFGIEDCVEKANEILCYGLTPKMLYDHPELKEFGAEIWYKTLHALGVVIINAHPFRIASYRPDPKPIESRFIDGIEVFNYGNLPEYNDRAEQMARENAALILTSGADAHVAGRVGFGGIVTQTRIRDEKTLAMILREGNYRLIK